KVLLTLKNEDKHITIDWALSMRNQCNFIEQNFYFRGSGSDNIKSLRLVSVPNSASPQKAGVVDGLPILVNNLFLAMEIPTAPYKQVNNSLTCNVDATSTLRKGDGFEINVAWGVTPDNQLRRGFLYYTEKI